MKKILVSTACLSIVLLFSSCNKKAELEAQVAENAKKQAQLDELKAKHDEIAARVSALNRKVNELETLARAFPSLEREESEVAKRHGEAKIYRDDLKASHDFLDGKLAIWRDAFNRSVTGKPVGTLRLAEGTELVDSTIAGFDGTSVKIAHKGGELSLPVAEAPREVQSLLLNEEEILQKLRIDRAAE